MSGEVQPRRRRDKKKKKAQLEALAKEEWEEGTALYVAEHEVEHEEEEEVVEAVRDSSSGEEEEPIEELTPNKTMTYKIIFFLLLILLGAVASLVLVEHPGGDNDLETSTRIQETESPIGSNFVPETNEEWEEEQRKEEDGNNGPDGIGYGDETSFLESISGFLNEFLEGEPTPEINQAETTGETPTRTTQASESPTNDFGEVEEEEEFEEITARTDGGDEQESPVSREFGDKITPTQISERAESQMEQPVDVEVSRSSYQQTQSTPPEGEISPETIRATVGGHESFSANHNRESKHQETQSSDDNSSPSPPNPPPGQELEDNFDFTQQNSKPDGGVQEVERLANGII